MSKRVRIQISGSIGSDLTTISVYKNSISVGNLLTGSITASALTEGILFDVDDDVYTFVARSDDGLCLNTSGSVVVANAGNTRYFTVASDGQGTVQANAPIVVSPTTGSFTQTVNFNVDSLFTIEAVATYPATFDGWYNKASGSSGETLWSSTNPLTITDTTFTGSDGFYAYFS